MVTLVLILILTQILLLVSHIAYLGFSALSRDNLYITGDSVRMNTKFQLVE